MSRTGHLPATIRGTSANRIRVASGIGAFETHLRLNLMLPFFIPGIVYLAHEGFPKLPRIPEELATAPSVGCGHIDQSGDRWRRRLVRA